MELELELILGILMILVGLISLGFVLKAKTVFPEGSELKKVTANLISVIIFLTAFSLWHVLREHLHWKEKFGEVIEYPEYIFITIAFLLIFKTAKDLYNTARRFGITEQ